ncbi:hypothetical protein DASC09_022270 [Saccharomycopsis crataegensis]|uniref:Uncharacterized protein n=1 Tax=Saccharomycopsis crataegensis TaxID=43959 RepID=A0AAV5QJC4_9ASCO|nr:hypothetical protein DASC09_022270 [Saccharomycopsis crataegensis]
MNNTIYYFISINCVSLTEDFKNQWNTSDFCIHDDETVLFEEFITKTGTNCINVFTNDFGISDTGARDDCTSI